MAFKKKINLKMIHSIRIHNGAEFNYVSNAIHHEPLGSHNLNFNLSQIIFTMNHWSLTT